MSREIDFSPYSLGDIELQATWYCQQQDEELARRYAREVERTVAFLADYPNVGTPCRFKEEEFRGLRYYLLARPFQAHLVYYRADDKVVSVFRVISGFRDLPRRLREPPGAD